MKMNSLARASRLIFDSFTNKQNSHAKIQKSSIKNQKILHSTVRNIIKTGQDVNGLLSQLYSKLINFQTTFTWNYQPILKLGKNGGLRRRPFVIMYIKYNPCAPSLPDPKKVLYHSLLLSEQKNLHTHFVLNFQFRKFWF
jgi:hypothetical protein